MQKQKKISANGKKTFHPGLTLMFITIFFVTGFQVYWLTFNYNRERTALKEKTNFGFRETIMKLQAANLNFQHILNDSNRNFNVSITSKSALPVKIDLPEPEDVSGFVNAIGEKVEDTLKKIGRINSTLVISSDEKDMLVRKDSATTFRFIQNGGKAGEGFLRLLYSVDSLQDSLRVTSIDSAFSVFLEKEKISVPFRITRTALDSFNRDVLREERPPFRPGRAIYTGKVPFQTKITIGFVHPVTYELKLGNILPYLMKRIASPLLFSLFLIGLTVLSLLFLYRNLQKQRRLTEIKNDFISNVTHELKTPIATVGVAIEALKSFNALNDPQKTKEYLDISQNELNRLSLLVDKVLKLSMFENHELELSCEEFDLKDIVSEVVSSFRLQFEKRHAVCNVTTEGNSFVIHADKLHLTSVVYNLIDNALKYSGEDPVIDIELLDETDTVKLQIRDNGIGIPVEYRSKIFDKFFRVPAGDTHNVKGYGLGLSYVAQVIAKHQGTVTVESEPGKGSIFIIKLPKPPVPEKKVIQMT